MKLNIVRTTAFGGTKNVNIKIYIKMTPKELARSCEENAIEVLLADIANRGFGVSTIEAIKMHLNKTSYNEFAEIIAESLNLNFDNIRNDSRLFDYVSDLSIDITNQYIALSNLFLASDLKLNWFRYTGSNLTTTRPFCLAMTKKDFFHKCEISRIISGEFPEFEKQNDIGYDESEIPTGLYSNTDEDNFLIYRGGYGCGHQINAVPDACIPIEIKVKLYETEEYKMWSKANS